jgi:hypothetical protein
MGYPHDRQHDICKTPEVMARGRKLNATIIHTTLSCTRQAWPTVVQMTLSYQDVHPFQLGRGVTGNQILMESRSEQSIEIPNNQLVHVGASDVGHCKVHRVCGYCCHNGETES